MPFPVEAFDSKQHQLDNLSLLVTTEKEATHTKALRKGYENGQRLSSCKTGSASDADQSLNRISLDEDGLICLCHNDEAVD